MLRIGQILQTVKGLIETKIDMVKFEVQEQITGILTRVTLLVLMAVSFLLALLFMSLSLAFFLGQYFASLHIGFLIVGIVFLIILLVVYLIRDNDLNEQRMKRGLNSFIFKAKMFKKRQENE